MLGKQETNNNNNTFLLFYTLNKYLVAALSLGSRGGALQTLLHAALKTALQTLLHAALQTTLQTLRHRSA